MHAKKKAGRQRPAFLWLDNWRSFDHDTSHAGMGKSTNGQVVGIADLTDVDQGAPDVGIANDHRT